MFCYKCGTQLPDGTVFCANCGAPQQAAQQPIQQPEQQPVQQPGPAYAQPVQPSYPPEQAYHPPTDLYTNQPGAPAQTPYMNAQEGDAANDVKTKSKGMQWWKIAVPIAAVIIAAAAVYYFFFLRNPVNIVNKALSNMSGEVKQRIDNTPLKAFGLLMDTFKDGTVTVNFNYEDTWFGDETSGSVSISSVAEAREFAITGDFKQYDGYWDEEHKIDFEAFINKDRAAFGSRLVDNNYYGFKYSTFRDDIRDFGDIVGLDDETMDMLSDYIEMFADMLDQKASKNDSESKYIGIMTDFYKKCEQTTEKVEIDSGGNSVKATKADIVITKEAILTLLNGFYDQLDKDEDVREMFDALYSSYYMVGMNYNSMMRELSSLIDDFDEYYSDSSTITLSFFIGNGDRLLRFELNTNIRFDGERIRIGASVDFGASATDRWVFRVDAGGNSARINWDYKERSNNIENSITITIDSESVTLMSVYSPSRGDFTLSVEYDYGRTEEISGTLRENSDGFTLSFDNFLDPDNDESFTLEIEGVKGANIKQIDYINIDKWDEDLIEKLADAFS